MRDLNRKFAPCIVDQECVAKNIVYFSFLVPLHHQIVYDFAIGCATGQSYFMALEKRCNCLVWASIPYNTMLASYCLFEVLIDRTNGGTFSGCQNVLDQLFKTINFSHHFTLNRLPYVVEKCPFKERKIGFVSTLKKLFRTSSFCSLGSADIDKLKSLETSKIKHAIVFNDIEMPGWAEQIYNTRNVRQRCSNKDKMENATVEMKDVELTYAQRSTVENELNNYRASQSSEHSKSQLFSGSLDPSSNLVMIDINAEEEALVRNRNSIRAWKKASLISSGFPDLITNQDALIIPNGSKEPNKENTTIKKDLAEITFQHPPTNPNKGNKQTSITRESYSPNIIINKDNSDNDNVQYTDRSERSFPIANVDIHQKDKISDINFQSSIIVTDIPQRNSESILKKDNSVTQQMSSKSLHLSSTRKETDINRPKPISQTMMDLASDLHQCGIITGHRVTQRHDSTSKATSSRLSDSKSFSMLDDQFAHRKKIPSSKGKGSSKNSNLCSSTSSTERFMSPQLVTSMENIEMRDQMWTPVPMSEKEIPSNTNNAYRDDDPENYLQMLDWERRLSRTIEQCMTEQIF